MQDRKERFPPFFAGYSEGECVYAIVIVRSYPIRSSIIYTMILY
jgi:hypothetical protein